MTTREEAAEQLRVIRTMMERATIFRALSGETALIGGAAALAAAWLSEGKQGWAWAGWWLFGAAMVLLFNGWQIFRASSAHGKPFLSAGLKMAIRGVLPPVVAGGFLGLLFIRAGGEQSDESAACMWIIHYGLALLALREFAPRSMAWLGWSFVAFGLLSLAVVTYLIPVPGEWMLRVNGARLMAFAFGGFHLVYGAAIVTTKAREGSA